MITNVIYYFIKIKTLEPLSIGNGEAELTDHDLIRDSKGDPFIPASTLAGVFRSYLSKEDEQIFIPDGKQSPFFISDATIEGKYKTSIRDGIRLGKNKITIRGYKYDVEILEPGACFDFRIEITVREEDNSKQTKEKDINEAVENEKKDIDETAENKEKNTLEQMEKIVEKLIANLNVGNILIGMKSNRGFGKVSVEYFGKKQITFPKENQKEKKEFTFDFNKFSIDNYKKCDVPDADIYEKYDTITIPLKQLGGISIKTYSAKAGDVDFEHVKSNGKPVIPGTSWNGLIRKQVELYNNYFSKEFGVELRAYRKLVWKV